MIQNFQLPFKSLQFFLVILLLIGIFFRFVNLDQKPYWEDETYTSLRISGYDVVQVTKQLFKGQEISIGDVQKYQCLSSEKNLIDTVKILTTRAEHPPLYYITARFWVQWFGSSVRVMRSLPVLLSLLAFPAIYWLCLELFASALVGWVAVALVAVSPIFVRYAQEARQYSLLAVLILVSGAALLRAIRVNTKISWAVYTVSVALGLYCHLLFSLVLAGYGIYVFTIENFRFTKTFTAYLIASLIGILTFTPWLWVIFTNIDQVYLTTDWLKTPLDFLSLARAWSVNLCHIFISWNYEYNNLLIYLVIPIFILVVYSIYFICQQTSKRVWLFILTLTGTTGLFLILPDLITGGQRSRIAQYAFPCYIGIQLAIAYLLATKITTTHPRQVKVWQIATTVLITAGVLSCVINSQAETWWGWSEFDVQAGRIINQSTHPLVISDERLTQVLPLSHRLNAKVKLLLVAEPDVPKIPHGFSNVFLFNPSKRLRSKLEQQQKITLKSVYEFRENLFVVSLLCVDEFSSNPCH